MFGGCRGATDDDDDDDDDDDESDPREEENATGDPGDDEFGVGVEDMIYLVRVMMPAGQGRAGV